MSNEAAAKNDAAAKPQLTRIQLDRVEFNGTQDFPGGNGIQPALNFGPPKAKGRQFFLGWFVPSYQVVTIEWYRQEGTEPEVFDVPMSGVAKTKRSAARKA